jgi:hypothetical protein
MTCDCCGTYDPIASPGGPPRRKPSLFALAAICPDRLHFAIQSGLRLGDVADLIGMCWSIDAGAAL